MSEIALPPIPEPKRYPSGHYPDGVLTYSADQLMEFARQAVLAERERCARMIDPAFTTDDPDEYYGGACGLEQFRNIARAIRRG